MGIETGKLNAIMNKPTVHDTFEKNENATFQERIEKAMEKAKMVIENANMLSIAKQLLEEHNIQEISSMDEETIDNTCSPYDAAVIVALCQTIETNKKEAN